MYNDLSLFALNDKKIKDRFVFSPFDCFFMTNKYISKNAILCNDINFFV